MSNAPVDLNKVAYAKLLRLADMRERSVFEMRRRLLAMDFEPEVVEAAIARAQSCLLLDDERFAEGYIQKKLRVGWGCERIKKGLLNRGVAPEIIDAFSQEFFDEGVELERALRELRQFKAKAENLNDARYRRLKTKGYSCDIISAALARIEVNEEV